MAKAHSHEQNSVAFQGEIASKVSFRVRVRVSVSARVSVRVRG